jgi:GTPase SAR1 family protein
MESIVTQLAIGLDLSTGKKTDTSPLVFSDSNTCLSHNSFIMQTIKCVVVGDGAVGK